MNGWTAGSSAGAGDIALINSKIFVSDAPFSYTPRRSIYTSEERFEQTIATIHSVRRHVPGCHILFIDNSILPAPMADRIRGDVDTFLNPVDDEALRQATDVSPTKAVGELAQLLFAARHLDRLPLAWRNLFKLCGRYVLNDTFDLSQFDNEQNQFKVNEPLTRYKQSVEGAPQPGVRGPAETDPITCYFTSFYKIARRHYAQYKAAIESSLASFTQDTRYFNEPIEMVLLDRIDDKTELDRLGITIRAAAEQWIEDV